MVLKMFKHNICVKDIANISELSEAQINAIFKAASVAH